MVKAESALQIYIKIKIGAKQAIPSKIYSTEGTAVRVVRPVTTRRSVHPRSKTVVWGVANIDNIDSPGMKYQGVESALSVRSHGSVRVENRDMKVSGSFQRRLGHGARHIICEN